jgi:hypothetical protein
VGQGAIKGIPNNLVPINLRASMAEFTTCERTIFIHLMMKLEVNWVTSIRGGIS